MVTVECIQKFRDKQNRIYGYRLQDNQGNTRDTTPQQLKNAIWNNQINVINITLTSNNHLISTTPISQQMSKNKSVLQQFSILTRKIVDKINKPKALKFKLKQDLEAINSKATLLGYETTQISKDFLLLENNTELILISNKSIQLDDSMDRKGYNNEYIGLFQETDFTFIDFHNTNTSKVNNMANIFRDCKAQTIDLSSFNTSKVTDMEGMFGNCWLKKLNLSRFDTSNVTDMKSMFDGCEVKILDLSNFNTSKVINMEEIFYGCKAYIKTTDPKLLENMKNR